MANSTNITFTNALAWQAKQTTITDSTPYNVGLLEDITWSAGTSRGLIKIVDPQGTTWYENTDKANPDITAGLGSYTENLPVDGDYKILEGDYEVTLTLFDNANTTATSFDATSVTAGKIVLGSTNTFNVGQAVVYSDGGGTTLGGLADGATYYVSVTTSGTDLYLSASHADALTGTDLAPTAGTGTQTLTAVDFEREFTYNVDYESPTMSLSPSYSTINPVYLKCVDNTSYLVNSTTPTIVRAWELIYPANNGTFTTSDVSLNTGVFYGSKVGAMNQIILTSTLTYTFNGSYSDGTVVNYTIADSVSGTPANGGIVVQIDSSGCSAYCCVKTAFNAYIAAQTTSESARLRNIWEEAADLLTMIQTAYSCNDSSTANVYSDRLSSITKCNGSCGDDGDVEQVVGIGTTPNVTRYEGYTASSNITTLTIADKFKNYNYTDGDFQCFVNGAEVTSTTGYTPTYDPITGIFSFGFTVPTSSKISYFIIKA